MPRAPNAAVIALDLVRRRAHLVAQDRRDRIALLEHDGALVPRHAAVTWAVSWQQGDVLLNDAGPNPP